MSNVVSLRQGQPVLHVQIGALTVDLAQLFEPAEFLAAAVLPAKRSVPDPHPVTRELELRQRNARNLLRWIGRRDAHRNWGETACWSALARDLHDEAQS